MEHYRLGRWFPDGQQILTCGNEASRPLRCYVQAMSGGPPSPITPDDVESAVIVPDNRRLLVTATSGAKELVEIGSTTARSVPGFQVTDVPIAGSTDGRSVFVQSESSGRARIDRIDVTTGVRTFVRDLAPPEVAGVVSVTVTQWLDDGRAYVYDASRVLSKRFVASGVK